MKVLSGAQNVNLRMGSLLQEKKKYKITNINLCAKVNIYLG